MRYTVVVVTFLARVIPTLQQEYEDKGNEVNQHVPKLEHKTAKAADNHGSGNLRSPFKKTLMARPHVNTNDRILKNKSSSDRDDTRECRLTSEDADVGLLSCGEGYYCQESPESKLGGICSAVTRKGSRSLNPYSINPDYCTTQENAGFYNITDCIPLRKCPPSCVCTATESAPTGYIKCLETYVCQTACGVDIYFSKELTLVYVDSKEIELQICYDVTKPYTARICRQEPIDMFVANYFFPSNYFTLPGAPCTYTINGAQCNACSFNKYVDCTNISEEINIAGESNFFGAFRINGIKGPFGSAFVAALQTPSGPLCRTRLLSTAQQELPAIPHSSSPFQQAQLGDADPPTGDELDGAPFPVHEP